MIDSWANTHLYYQTGLVKPVHEHDWRMLDATLS